MVRCHFSRGLIVPLSTAFEYYSNIEAYVERYPRYYGKIEVICRTADSITTRQFLNISLDENNDHVNVVAKYTFFPEKEIKYEIMEGYGRGIENSIVFLDQDQVGKPYKCSVKINHIPLDLMYYPPPRFETSRRRDEYDRMLDYFLEQDLVPLEGKNWGGWKIGQICTICQKGTLQMTGEREETGIKQTDFFRCDYCGHEFKNYKIETSSTIELHD
jgi:hypothetical protein